jgi:hypothetical protein
MEALIYALLLIPNKLFLVVTRELHGLSAK